MKARLGARVVNQVEVAVEVDVDQLQAPVFEDRDVRGDAAVAECAVAAVEEEARAEQEVDEAVFVEVDGLAAPGDEGIAGRIGIDTGCDGRVAEYAGPIIDEEPVAGAVTAGMVVGREQVDVAVIVEVSRENSAANTPIASAETEADVWKLPLPWLTWSSAIESVFVAGAPYC